MSKNYQEGILYLPSDLVLTARNAILESVPQIKYIKYYHAFDAKIKKNYALIKDIKTEKIIYIYAPFPLIYIFRKDKNCLNSPHIHYKSNIKPLAALFGKHLLKFSLLWERFRLGSDVESPTMRRLLLPYFIIQPKINIGTWLQWLQ